MTFSDKVKYVRKKLCLTQTELASGLEVSFSTVNRWESKNSEPQLAHLGRFEAFCEAHGIVFEHTEGNSK